MSIDIAVSVQNINFRYNSQTAHCFTDLNLEINAGEKFGLFGPNGAGKTTLIHCIIGLLSIQKGNIDIFGTDISKHKKKIHSFLGFVPQDFSFYQELSPVQNLAFYGAWYGLNTKTTKAKTEELLEVFNLTEVRHKQVQSFSGGMKRRVNLAIGLINSPKLIVLDEPTVGVDIQTRHAIINYLKELNKNGTTIIYTSHLLSEAEELCDKVALIDNGKIIVNDSLDNLFSAYSETSLESLYLKLTGKSYRDV